MCNNKTPVGVGPRPTVEGERNEENFTSYGDCDFIPSASKQKDLPKIKGGEKLSRQPRRKARTVRFGCNNIGLFSGCVYQAAYDWELCLGRKYKRRSAEKRDWKFVTRGGKMDKE